jgi:hypothetical protein
MAGSRCQCRCSSGGAAGWPEPLLPSVGATSGKSSRGAGDDPEQADSGSDVIFFANPTKSEQK